MTEKMKIGNPWAETKPKPRKKFKGGLYKDARKLDVDGSLDKQFGKQAREKYDPYLGLK